MLKKTVAIFMAAAMTFGGAVIASAEETAVPALTLDFEDEAVLGGSQYGEAVYATAGGGQSGEGYLSLPGAEDAFIFNFVPEEGGDDANYILSFYAKTSVGENLFVETTPYVDYRGTLIDWKTYRMDMGLLAISNGEGKSYLVTGLTTVDGGEWVENRLEFRVPEGCDRLQIQIGTSFVSDIAEGTKNVADPFRAIDSVKITKTEDNMIRNGNFECVGYKKDGSHKMPYSNWYVDNGDYAGITTVNGNKKLVLDYPGEEANGAAACFKQYVYLYPGRYVLSYDAKGESTQGKVNLKLQGNTTAVHPAFQNGKYLFVHPSTNADFDHTHVILITISETDTYLLQMNNTWLGGKYTFDNFKLTKLEENEGFLRFGGLQYTGNGNGEHGDKTWAPTSENLMFAKYAKETYSAGDAVQAFGVLPQENAAESAQVVTAVYKISDGKKSLFEMQVDAGIPGEGFKGTAITIPETTKDETVLVKAMVLDANGSMRPIGDDFILQ